MWMSSLPPRNQHPATNGHRRLALGFTAILLGGGALAVSPFSSEPGTVGLQSGWWLAALTTLGVAVAVRPLLVAILVAGLAAPASAESPARPTETDPTTETGPPDTTAPAEVEPPFGESATMRKVDSPGSSVPPPTPDGSPSPHEPTPDEQLVPSVPSSVGSSTAVVEPGDHLWALASDRLTRHLGRRPLLIEQHEYWTRVVAANLDTLTTGDPDLILPGEPIELPDPG